MAKGPQLVFIVDRDPAVRDSLKFALELDGLNVETCGDTAGLMRHPRLWQAHCLVLDHHPPAADDLATLAWLRAQGRRLPVILITDHATAALRRRAAAAGVRHVVEKPLLDGALVECIKDVLSRSDAA